MTDTPSRLKNTNNSNCFGTIMGKKVYTTVTLYI